MLTLNFKLIYNITFKIKFYTSSKIEFKLTFKQKLLSKYTFKINLKITKVAHVVIKLKQYLKYKWKPLLLLFKNFN